METFPTKGWAFSVDPPAENAFTILTVFKKSFLSA
jgi:hypothetical protein